MKFVGKKEFEQLNLRIGKVKAIKKHPKTDDYILLIDLGSVDHDIQLVANLKPHSMASLIGKQVLVLENYKSTFVKGIESQGLLLITHKNGKPVLLHPEKNVLLGVHIHGISGKEVFYRWKKGQ